MWLELSESRMRRDERLTTHPRIFGWVDRSSRGENYRIQFRHERERWSAIVREVEG
jgi:hypothetical protein